MPDDVSRLEKIVIRIDERLEALIDRIDTQMERQEKRIDDHECRIRSVEDKHTSLSGKLTIMGIGVLAGVSLLCAWVSAVCGKL